MSQVADLGGVLARIGGWKVGSYTASKYPEAIAHALQAGYAVETSGHYELTDAGIAYLRSLDGDRAADAATAMRAASRA